MTKKFETNTKILRVKANHRKAMSREWNEKTRKSRLVWKTALAAVKWESDEEDKTVANERHSA